MFRPYRVNVDKWDKWPEIRRVNPLTAISPAFRKRLIEERNDALMDSRLKARFLSYRLNLPSSDESEVLLTVADWELVESREVPEREGKPIVAVDLGAGRAWSAAIAWWRNGRVEGLALAPGIPDLESQEKRDRVPSGLYRKLQERGRLDVAEGLRVQPPSQLWEAIRREWGKPQVVVCDRFRLSELQDTIGPHQPIEARVTRWSDAAFDIRALRQQAKDGNLAVDVDSRLLIEASLSASLVKNDDAGNTRLAKKGGSNNTARDDVSAALVLGGWQGSENAGHAAQEMALSGSGVVSWRKWSAGVQP